MSKTLNNQSEPLLTNEIDICSNHSNEKIDNFEKQNETDNVLAEISDKEEKTNELNGTETNDSCAEESSVENIEEITVILDSSANLTQKEHEDQNMHENLTLLNKRKYDIKKSILTVIKCVIITILIQNLLAVVLVATNLFTGFYLFALYNFIAIAFPIVLIAIILYIWERLMNEETKFLDELLYEIIKLNHYRYYKDCEQALNRFKDTMGKKHYIYKETIRKIEDLRYYTIMTAVFYGGVQIILQVYVLIKVNDNMLLLPLQIAVLIVSGILICLSIFIHRNNFCDFRSDLGIYRISIFMFFITITSTFLYILDIFTDFVVTVIYFHDSHYIRGTVTLLLIILPGIYNSWHEHYRQHTEFRIGASRIITTLLNLNPLFGYQKNLEFQKEGRKAEKEDDEKQQIKSYLAYIKNNFNVAILRYYECFTESCSQLIVQMSFLLSRLNFSELQNEKLTFLSSGISVLNVAVSVVLFFRAKRIKMFEEDPLPIEGMVVQFVGYITVASRILALSFLASQLPYIAFLSIFVHWLLIFIWILYTTRRYSLSLCLNNAGQAIFYTYTPAINSSAIEIIFQIVIFIENIAAILVWNYSKYNRFTTNGILILIFAIIVPSIVGWVCRYFYRKKYKTWVEDFEKARDDRFLVPC